MKKYFLLMLGALATSFFLFSPKITFAASWVNIGFPDKQINATFVDPTNSNKIVVSVFGPQNYYTEDGGQNWQIATTTPQTGCNQFTQSPLNKNEIWAACYGIYHSVDGGHSFFRVAYASTVSQIIVDSKGVIYTSGLNLGIKRSFDGLLWEAITVPGGQYAPNLFINKADDSVYASFSNGLYKSSDAGRSWVLVNNAEAFNGFSQMIFFQDKICAVRNSAYLCSANGGYSWSYNQGLSQRADYIYNIAQNPDDENNIAAAFIKAYGTLPGSEKKIYSIKSGETFWASEDIPYPFNSLSISQGIVFASSSQAKNGLWRNDGVAVKPVVEEKYPVIIVPGFLGSWEKNGEWQIEPLLGKYDQLLLAFKENGYQENKDLFTFPYEWRRDNRISSSLLKTKIEEAKAKSGKNKAIIIAHSMGGLVARHYAESDDYQNDISEIIFLGTPHVGSPKSYVAWESGDIKFHNGFSGYLLNYIFNEEAKLNGYIGETGLFDYIRNRIVTIKELLPTFDYLKIAHNFLSYPNSYPKNEFIEELEENKYKLKERDIKVLNVIGDTGANTVEYFDIVRPSGTYPFWEDGIPLNYYFSLGGIHSSNGDDTVLSSYKLNIGEMNIVINSPHTDLPTNAIPNILDELHLEISQSPIVKNINYLLVGAHSPVDFYVQAPNGQKIGFNKETGGEFSEMENAFYSGNDPTQPEFVVIRNPEEGEYKVVSTGTGNGSYGIESTYANEETNQVLSTMFSGNANVGVDNIIDVSLNASKGEIESKIEDKTPPEISLSLADKYTRWDSLDIVAEATDLESGVADTKVFFDGVEIGNNINLNLISMSLGDHEIKVMAEDIAGNRSELVKNIVIYTDLDSTLKDLKYLFDRGEFKSYGSMFRYYSKIESLKYYPQDASSVYKNVIKNLGQELKNKQISTFAYNLIKNDILYLLGGLSEPKTT